jgi:hypothetical protein
MIFIHYCILQDFVMRHIVFALAFSGSFGMSPAFSNEESGKMTAANDPDQAIKCRKVEVTGSLVKKGKVCKTAAEWKRIQDNGNRVARAIWDQGAKPTNGQFTTP